MDFRTLYPDNPQYQALLSRNIVDVQYREWHSIHSLYTMTLTTEDISNGICTRQEWAVDSEGNTTLLNEDREVSGVFEIPAPNGIVDFIRTMVGDTAVSCSSDAEILMNAGSDDSVSDADDNQPEPIETRETTIEEVEARIDAALAENADPTPDADVIGAPTHRNMPEPQFRQLWRRANEE